MLPCVRTSKPKHWGEENAPCTTTKMRRRKKKKKDCLWRYCQQFNKRTTRLYLRPAKNVSKQYQRLLHKKCDCPFPLPKVCQFTMFSICTCLYFCQKYSEACGRPWHEWLEALVFVVQALHVQPQNVLGHEFRSVHIYIAWDTVALCPQSLCLHCSFVFSCFVFSYRLASCLFWILSAELLHWPMDPWHWHLHTVLTPLTMESCICLRGGWVGG